MVNRTLLLIISIFSFLVIVGNSLTAAASDINIREDPWFSSDKSSHFVISFSLSVISYGALWTLGKPITRDPPIVRAALSTGMGLVPGIMKEIYDAGQPGKFFSWRDLTWDVIGAAAGSVGVWAIEIWHSSKNESKYSLQFFGRGFTLCGKF